ncbi:hypothetical protein [Natranaerofaba carboxydovora]|uniref:hypothetical protein n=1 Tax=Natranaerofaba carboxydovora TaxID=2742683 RepID=UPI001F142D6B|nr:hypothetical protein [Natranaerofaba carboxydovora]UMZ73078.1 hypothetical protein ACONDI_00624 [Natranaerofaba carboxydovora]
MTQKFFPGNNSARGFHSFFPDILYGYKYKFIIKGGPGTGKSSYMKKIADHLGQNYNKELYYCASDSTSLDAISFPEIKTIFVDGTHPHVIDPNLPAAGEYIIDLARYLDSEKLIPKKSKLEDIQDRVKSYYNIVYSYFVQANECLSRQYKLFNNQESTQNLNDLKTFLLEPLKETCHCKFKGKNNVFTKRSLFLRAFTPEGVVSFVKNLIQENTKIFLVEGNIKASEHLLKIIEEHATFCGHQVELYHHPFEPSILEGIRLPQLNIIYLSSKNYPEIYDLDKNIYYKASIPLENNNKTILSFNKEELSNAINQQDSLISRGINYLAEMKKIREELELHYSSAQDFDGVEQNRRKTLEKVKSLINHH